MDVAFLLRAQQLLADREPARLDFSVLTAALAAQRASQGDTRPCGALRFHNGEEEALVEIVLAGPGWRHAASVKLGCFSRVEAGRGINAL